MVTTENAPLKAGHDDVIAWTSHLVADFLTTNSEHFSVCVCVSPYLWNIIAITMY